MTKLAAVLLALLIFAPQEKFDPSKHPWARWKAGASVKYKATYAMSGGSSESDFTQTLSKVTEKDYTVTTTVEVMGQKNEGEEVWGFPENVGQEALTVEGQKYECTIWKSKGTKGGVDSENSVWVPTGKDFALKMISKGQEAMEYVAVKLADPITVREKKWECVRLEGKIHSQEPEMTMTLWMNSSVPGGWVKSEMKFDGGVMEMALAEVNGEGLGREEPAPKLDLPAEFAHVRKGQRYLARTSMGSSVDEVVALDSKTITLRSKIGQEKAYTTTHTFSEYEDQAKAVRRSTDPLESIEISGVTFRYAVYKYKQGEEDCEEWWSDKFPFQIKKVVGGEIVHLLEKIE